MNSDAHGQPIGAMAWYGPAHPNCHTCSYRVFCGPDRTTPRFRTSGGPAYVAPARRTSRPVSRVLEVILWALNDGKATTICGPGKLADHRSGSRRQCAAQPSMLVLDTQGISQHCYLTAVRRQPRANTPLTTSWVHSVYHERDVAEVLTLLN